MRYTKKELRAVDMFALLLVGLGIVFVAFGCYMLAGARDPRPVLPRHFAQGRTTIVVDGRKLAKSVAVSKVYKTGFVSRYGYQHAWVLLGICYTSLGLALNLALRRVVRNDCEDVVAAHDEAEGPAVAG